MAEDQDLAHPHKNAQRQQKQPQSTCRTYRSVAHPLALLNGMVALRDSGTLFDVVIVAEGKPIQAHRILLAASCDYFRGMFAGGLREMQQTEVLVHGVSYSAMCKILHFIYTSELELSLDNVQEILAAACLLQISDVIQFCCEFLMSWVDNENLLEMYKLADLFGLTHLSDQLDSYILKNFPSFSKTETYRQLPLNKVYSLLCSQRLEVNSENEVYEAALHYHYTPEQIERDEVSLEEPPKLLETVRFPLMEQPVLLRLHDRLTLCPLKETLAESLRYHEEELLQPLLQGPQTQLRSEFHCVVGFGGMYSAPSEVLSNQAKYLHPQMGEWRPLITTQVPRMSNQGIAVLYNFVYLIGGDNNTQGFRAESMCWRYDPRHERWCQIQSLQQQHADHCVCVVGEHIYAIAGRDYHEELRAVEQYDPKTDSWTYVAPLQKEVYAHAGAVLDGKVYISCGRRQNIYLKELHCYDPATDQWESKAEGPVGRAWHGMAALRGRLFVIGGSNNDPGFRKDVLEVACYNPVNEQWTTVCQLPAGHGEPGIAVLDNQIYVLGGRSHNLGSRMGYVHIYDAEGDCWKDGPSLKDSISGMAACVLTLPRALITAENWELSSWERVHYDSRNASDWEEFESSDD
ncbi:kelch-like protein 22 [Latimeria chalumnae]|uniref:kelch-like protein 22 n=1 Tax=Latimeria chalumnae TaxID=7897 RepID=UPI0006D93F01|nr:PREDICTED: kelch-like protein 22 [Latimeria chalumnae]|eukprot:XP_005987260.2 PREDICTED: kelch-like protein 22 [Latimeria chalumnae]